MHEPLIEAIKARLPQVVVGDGTNPASMMGPLVTEEHRDKVASYIESGQRDGATVVADGREHPLYKDSDGFYLGVSLITDVTPEMSCYKDEIFGPVLTVVHVGSYEEAVKLTNSHEFGNGTAIFTRDGGAARQFQFDIDVGMVGINVPIPVPVSYYSFGGWRSSLFGDSHIYGPEGVRFYTKGKVITSRWPDPGTSEDQPGLPPHQVAELFHAGPTGLTAGPNRSPWQGGRFASSSCGGAGVPALGGFAWSSEFAGSS